MGHKSPKGHSPQLGLRDWQTARPWLTSIELKWSQYFFGDKRQQVPLDLFGNGLFSKAHPLGEAGDMDIDGDAFGLMERRGEDDVGRLAGYAGKGNELGHGFGHASAEIGEQFPRRAQDALGLVAEKSRRPDVQLELGLVRPGEGFDVGVFGEQGRRHLVDPLVRALRGKDGGHQKLPGCFETQAGFGRGVDLL